MGREVTGLRLFLLYVTLDILKKAKPKQLYLIFLQFVIVNFFFHLFLLVGGQLL